MSSAGLPSEVINWQCWKNLCRYRSWGRHISSSSSLHHKRTRSVSLKQVIRCPNPVFGITADRVFISHQAEKNASISFLLFLWASIFSQTRLSWCPRCCIWAPLLYIHISIGRDIINLLYLCIYGWGYVNPDFEQRLGVFHPLDVRMRLGSEHNIRINKLR